MLESCTRAVSLLLLHNKSRWLLKHWKAFMTLMFDNGLIFYCELIHTCFILLCKLHLQLPWETTTVTEKQPMLSLSLMEVVSCSLGFSLHSLHPAVPETSWAVLAVTSLWLRRLIRRSLVWSPAPPLLSVVSEQEKIHLSCKLYWIVDFLMCGNKIQLKIWKSGLIYLLNKNIWMFLFEYQWWLEMKSLHHSCVSH